MTAARFSRLRLFRFVALVTCIMSMLVSTNTARAEPGTQSELTAITGAGAGRVLVSPTAAGQV